MPPPLTGIAFALARVAQFSMNLRGRVIRVNRQTINTDDLALTYDIALDNATMQCSEEPGVMRAVPMLQAGVSDLGSTDAAPTGIIYVPEEGTRVLLGFDGVRYVIIGCYTGPARTNETATQRSDAVSYAGVSEKTKTQVGGLTFGDDKDWFFGLTPGDVVLGKARHRVKVTGDGVVMGVSPNCMTMLKANDERLDRCKTLDARMIGYYKAHRVEWGEETQAAAHLAQPDIVPAPAAGTITTEIFECTPYPHARKAFLIEQKGHVSDGLKDDARQGLLGAMGKLAVNVEAPTGSLEPLNTVVRKAVLQPLPTAKIGKIPLMEMLVDHIATFEEQIDADGSWFRRSGNMMKLIGPGQRRVAPFGTLDSSTGYDSKLQIMHMATSKGGVPTAYINMFSLASLMQLFAANIQFLCPTGLSIVSGATQIIATPGGFVINGPVTINGALTVNGATSLNGVAAVSGQLAVAGMATVVGGVQAAGPVTSQSSVIARLGTPGQKAL